MLDPAKAAALNADITNTFDTCVLNPLDSNGVTTEPVGGFCPVGMTLTSRKLWARIDRNQADGFDGGPPRHALGGYAAGGSDLPADGGANVVTPTDFSKKIGKAKPTYSPRGGGRTSNSWR